jgi:myosin heavy subunit
MGTPIIWGGNIIDANKDKALKVIVGNAYVVTISHTLNYLKPNNNDADGDYSDYNFRNNGNVSNGLLQDLNSLASGTVQFEIVDIADDDEIVRPHFNSVDSLSQPVKEEAIKLARDILDKLKIQFGSQTIDGLMKSENDTATKKLFGAMDKVGIIFNNHAQIAEKMQPTLLEDDDIKAAKDVLGVFKYNNTKLEIRSLEKELKEAKQAGNQELVDILSNEINKLKVETTKMPDEWRGERDKPVKELVDKVEVGLDKLINKMQEMTQAGLSNVSTGRDLGGDDKAQQQGKQSTMDLSKMQAETLKNIERLNQQSMVMQKMSNAVEGEKQNANQQQAAEQKQKDSQQARAERQQQRAQRQQERAERQQQRAERLQNQQDRAQRQADRAQSQQERAQRQQERVQRQQERLQRQNERNQQQQQQQQAEAQRQQRQVERTQRRLQRAQMQEQQQRAADQQIRQQQMSVAKINERDAASYTAKQNANIAENLRQMRSEQMRQKNEASVVQSEQKSPLPQAEIAARTPPSAPITNNSVDNANNMMQSLLSGGGLGTLQSMSAMQNMEIPDALKPNSPARTVKAIAQQKEMEQMRSQAVESGEVSKSPTSPTSDLPILIKQNQLTR